MSLFSRHAFSSSFFPFLSSSFFSLENSDLSGKLESRPDLCSPTALTHARTHVRTHKRMVCPQQPCSIHPHQHLANEHSNPLPCKCP